MRKSASIVSAVVAGLLAAGAVTTALPVAAQDKAPAVSKGLAKPLKAAQDAMAKKDWQGALTALSTADATAGKSAYDQHLINEMRGFVYVRTNNYAEAARNLEAGLGSGFLPQADVPTRVKALSQINYQLKNYDKAIEYGNRAIKGGYADSDMYTLVGQAYYVKGDYKGARKFADDYVDGQVKAGQTPKKNTLELILSSCVKLNDDACTTEALERLVTYYPSAEYWQNLTYALFKQPGIDDKTMLATYRLAADVDAIKRPGDYTEMAQLAIEQGSPGEAVSVLDKGFAQNVFTDQREKEKNQRLLESAKKLAATDQAALPKLEADASKAATGGASVGLGKGYFSYGQYDKAATALSAGIQKGGVQDASEAKLLLGISQLKAGQKADAQKTFASLKDDPKYGRLASLWSIHARS